MAIGGDPDALAHRDSNPRPLLADDTHPLDSPSIPAGLASAGIEVIDPVVQNNDAQLSNTDHVDEGEPSIAVDPRNPDRIVLQSGSDGYETWSAGGCTPDPQDCPEGAGNAYGSIWYSANDGQSWTKGYVIPLPPGAGVPGACVCDRVVDWGADGRLSDVFLVFDHNGYLASTTDPLRSASWVYPTGPTGQAIPVATPQGLAATGYCFIDQPQALVNRDPANPAQQDVYVAYHNDCTRADNPLYSAWVASAHGDSPAVFTEHHELWSYPVNSPAASNNPGCDAQAVSSVSNGPATVSIVAPRLAADPTRGYVYALWAVGHGTVAVPSSQGEVLFADVNENRLIRSADGGVTWQLNGCPNGINIADSLTTGGGGAPVGSAPASKFATFNALLGGTHSAAVDPATGDVYYVYGDLDPTTRVATLAIRRVRFTTAGVASVGPATTLSPNRDAALPAIAVTSNGVVGVMFDAYEGVDATGYPVVSVHLAESTDDATTFTDHEIARFVSVEKNDQSNARQRPLGDYQQLKAVGNTLYGVFTANGAAFGRPFPNWEPIFVRANVPARPEAATAGSRRVAGRDPAAILDAAPTVSAVSQPAGSNAWQLLLLIGFATVGCALTWGLHTRSHRMRLTT